MYEDDRAAELVEAHVAPRRPGEGDGALASGNTFSPANAASNSAVPARAIRGHNVLPLYPILAELDNCVFATDTVWLSTRQGDRHFRYDAGHRVGRQYICDGTDLRAIAAAQYDCVLSCNSLEHIANPLKALDEWASVLTDNGAIIVIVPAKEYTFDHRRPDTTLAHLVADRQNNVSEDDLSHLDEIVALHDLSRDRAAGGPEAFRRRCVRNNECRCLHHHVFGAGLLALRLSLADFGCLRC